MAERPESDPGDDNDALPDGPPPDQSRPLTSDARPLPEDPFTRETIHFMRGDELLAVRLRGGPVSKTAVPTGVAGGFLYRFDELVKAMAATLAGRHLGSRGTLPAVPDVGLFSLVGVQWGSSVTFHLSLGGDEPTRISSEGGISSMTDEVLARLDELLVAAAAGDEARLWASARALGGRVGGNFERLLEVFIHEEVDSVWRLQPEERPIGLTSTRAHRAKAILELPELPRVDERRVRGFLYRVDSRDHAFQLEPEGDDERITGTYPEHLREDIREAWDKEVIVQLRTTHHFLYRQEEPEHVDYELIDVIQIIEP